MVSGVPCLLWLIVKNEEKKNNSRDRGEGRTREGILLFGAHFEKLHLKSRATMGCRPFHREGLARAHDQIEPVEWIGSDL